MNCVECKKEVDITQVYRCRICHLRYCDECALKHFGLYEDKNKKVKYKNILVTILWIIRKKIFGK